MEIKEKEILFFASTETAKDFCSLIELLYSMESDFNKMAGS